MMQILLMVILSIPPLASGHDFGNNGALIPLLASLLRDFARNALLLRAVVIDGAAVLRSDIGALAVSRRRIV